MSAKFKILKREISDKYKPLVVLEISANHGNSLNKTIKTILIKYFFYLPLVSRTSVVHLDLPISL